MKHSVEGTPQEDGYGPFRSWLIKGAVWLLFFLALFLLRSFFLLIFLTFVFAYIQSAVVQRMGKKIRRRSVRVVFAGVLLLATLSAVAGFVVPRVHNEVSQLAERLPSYLHDIDAKIVQLVDNNPLLASFLPRHHLVADEPATVPHPQNEGVTDSLTLTYAQRLLGDGHESEPGAGFRGVLKALRSVLAYLSAITSAFLLSLLFSFLIVLDLPRLIKSVRSLRRTKLGFVYEEVAPSIVEFGQVLGRAFEAQLVIAFLNTALTAVGLVLLGLTERLAFFSVIVFFCSFIPVAGVFISSAPICLIALQQGGWGLSLLTAFMITAVHMVEAYILNPRIYGHHLRMNPVLVLIILTLGGKLFGVWGLVLGVPVCTYIFGHAIQYKAPHGNTPAVT